MKFLRFHNPESVPYKALRKGARFLTVREADNPKVGTARTHYCQNSDTRSTTKRPVMVLPYGGTFHSALDYVRQWFDEQAKDRNFELPESLPYIPSEKPPLCNWSLGHWSAAEMAEYARSGRRPFWDRAGGSAMFTTDPYLAVGASGYATHNSSGGATVVSGRNTVAPIYGSADYKVETTVAGVSSQYPRAILSDKSLTIGQRYRLQIWYQRVSGTQTTARLNFSSSGSSPYINLPNFDGSVQNFTVDFVCTSNAGNATPPMIVLDGTLTGEYRFVCDIIPLGALTIPEIQSIPVLRDGTLIGGNPGRMVGCTPYGSLSQKSVIKIAAADYTTSSVQILGGSILDRGGVQMPVRIDSIVVDSTNAVNFSLSTVASGTGHVNAQAVSGKTDIATFANRIVTGTSLWATFSGATNAAITVELSPL